MWRLKILGIKCNVIFEHFTKITLHHNFVNLWNLRDKIPPSQRLDYWVRRLSINKISGPAGGGHPHPKQCAVRVPDFWSRSRTNITHYTTLGWFEPPSRLQHVQWKIHKGKFSKKILAIIWQKRVDLGGSVAPLHHHPFTQTEKSFYLNPHNPRLAVRWMSLGWSLRGGP